MDETKKEPIDSIRLVLPVCGWRTNPGAPELLLDFERFLAECEAERQRA